MQHCRLSSQCALALTITVLSGCSFVQLTDGGSAVIQAASPDVQQCRDIGVVNATTRSKVVVSRGSGKVQEELIVLARNQAAELGANAIVPIGEPQAGRQSFRAYACN